MRSPRQLLLRCRDMGTTISKAVCNNCRESCETWLCCITTRKDLSKTSRLCSTSHRAQSKAIFLGHGRCLQLNSEERSNDEVRTCTGTDPRPRSHRRGSL